MSPFDIPHNVVRKNTFRVPIKPISQCDKAYFRVRYCLFQPQKWPISQAEMVHIAMRRNTP